MELKDRTPIAISLFTGCVLALSVFVGTLAGSFLLEGIKCFSQNSLLFIFGIAFSTFFIALMYLIIRFSLKALFNPLSIDYRKFGNLFKKIFLIK